MLNRAGLVGLEHAKLAGLEHAELASSGYIEPDQLELNWPGISTI